LRRDPHKALARRGHEGIARGRVDGDPPDVPLRRNGTGDRARDRGARPREVGQPEGRTDSHRRRTHGDSPTARQVEGDLPSLTVLRDRDGRRRRALVERDHPQHAVRQVGDGPRPRARIQRGEGAFSETGDGDSPRVGIERDRRGRCRRRRSGVALGTGGLVGWGGVVGGIAVAVATAGAALLLPPQPASSSGRAMRATITRGIDARVG